MFLYYVFNALANLNYINSTRFNQAKSMKENGFLGKTSLKKKKIQFPWYNRKTYNCRYFEF